MFIRVPGLRQAREKSGLSEWKLARDSGVGYNTIRRLESGHSAQEQTARKLARALGVEFEDLIQRSYDELSREEQAKAFARTREIDEMVATLPNELIQLVAINVMQELDRRNLSAPVYVPPRATPDVYIEASKRQREELRRLQEEEKQ